MKKIQLKKIENICYIYIYIYIYFFFCIFKNGKEIWSKTQRILKEAHERYQNLFEEEKDKR